MQLKFVIFGEIDNTIVLCCFVLFCSGIKGREFSSEIKKNVRISIKIGKKVDKSTHNIKTQKSNYKINQNNTKYTITKLTYTVLPCSRFLCLYTKSQTFLTSRRGC